MEANRINEERTITVKVTELLKKFKHREDRYNFCRQSDKSLINI